MLPDALRWVGEHGSATSVGGGWECGESSSGGVGGVVVVVVVGGSGGGGGVGGGSSGGSLTRHARRERGGLGAALRRRERGFEQVARWVARATVDESSRVLEVFTPLVRGRHVDRWRHTSVLVIGAVAAAVREDGIDAAGSNKGARARVSAIVRTDGRRHSLRRRDAIIAALQQTGSRHHHSYLVEPELAENARTR